MSVLGLPETLKYVIAGTGHSGTFWASNVASACGYRACHEGIFRNEINRDNIYDWEVESSCRAAPWLMDLPRDVKVIHLVRHPLGVIRSLFFRPGKSFAFRNKDWIQRKLGYELPSESPEEYLMGYWLAWTDLIDKVRPEVVQVEDGSVILARALGGAMPHHEVARCGRRCPEDSPSLGWLDLPEGELRDRVHAKARVYGYIDGVTTEHTYPGRQ